jgi:hypothetical protein
MSDDTDTTHTHGIKCHCVDCCNHFGYDPCACIHGTECDECRTMRDHLQTMNMFPDGDPDLVNANACKKYFEQLEKLVVWYNKLETFALAVATNDTRKYIAREDMDEALRCIQQMHHDIDCVLCEGRIMTWSSEDEYVKFYRQFWGIANEYGCIGVHWSVMSFEEARDMQGCDQTRIRPTATHMTGYCRNCDNECDDDICDKCNDEFDA